MGQAELGVGYMFDLAQQPDGLHHEGLHPGIDAFDLMRLNVIGFDNLAQTVQQGVRDAAVRVGLVGCSLLGFPARATDDPAESEVGVIQDASRIRNRQSHFMPERGGMKVRSSWYCWSIARAEQGKPESAQLRLAFYCANCR
jgi:hypothetical protein